MNIRKAFLTLSLVSIFSAIVGSYLLYHSSKELLLTEFERDISEEVETLKEDVNNLIAFSSEAVTAMSKFDAFQYALASPDSSALSRADHVLDNFAHGLMLDVGFLIDASGVCVASTNRNLPSSFVGTNYSFRKYFREAMNGAVSVELALGIRTRVRGIFVSSPVFKEGTREAIGVAVMKVSTEPLDKMFINSRNVISSLVQDTGMIFISSKQEWNLKLLWDPSQESLTQLQESQQFGKGPWDWTGLESHKSDTEAVDRQGRGYSLRSASLTNLPGWKIVTLYDLEAMAKRIVWPAVGKAGYAGILLFVALVGAITCLYVMGNKDIESRRLAENALAESELRFRNLFEKNNAVMLLVNPGNGSIEDANVAAARYYGYSREALCKMKIGDINCLSTDEIFDEMNKARSEQRNYFLFPHRLSTGEIRRVEVHSSPVDIGAKRLLFSIVHDITKRVEAENRLAEKTALLNGLLDSIPDIVFFKNVQGAYFGGNSECAKVVGSNKEQVEGKTDYDLFNTEQADLYREQDQAVLQSVTARHNEEWITYPDSRRILVDTLKAPLRSIEGEVIGIVGVSRDITDKRIAEKKLKELNETLETKVLERSADLLETNQKLQKEVKDHLKTTDQLRNSKAVLNLIVETAPMGVFMIQEGKYSFVNDTFIKILGLSDRSQALGQPVTSACGNAWADLLQHLWIQYLRESNSCRIDEINLITHQKKSVYLNVSMEITELWGNQALIGFVTDITNEKMLRTHLDRSQRMEALGTLSGGIAHDFNNILYAILGLTELALDDVPEGSSSRKNLESVVKAVERASKLVAHVLAFGRENETERTAVQVGPIVKESLNFLRSAITANIEIRKNIQPNLHSVLADATQIHQIIMNLGTNSAHAMKDSGGVLTVDLHESLLNEEFTQTRPELTPGIYQRLRVSDTGHGMSPETLERIFDPYFTTKERGEGTGLGLSILHEIVKGYGGAVCVESAPGLGTTLEIYLPIIDEEESGKTEDDVIPIGTSRILLIDDEEILLVSTVANLERLGYQVVAENNPLNALERIENSPDSFDLVITDLAMPKMTGLQLASNIYSIRQDLPIILITGYGDGVEEMTLSDFGIRDLLHKPVSKRLLAQSIKKVLDRWNPTVRHT